MDADTLKLHVDSDEIHSLVGEFEACTLPRVRWTHAAHLTVALWYLLQTDVEQATGLIRSGIQKYNQACGVEMTKTSGYHETITLFSIWAIRKYIRSVELPGSIEEIAKGLLASAYGDKNLPLQYYTRERLMSWEARSGWAEPDIKPLEALDG
jgi:hypothetical protein